MSKMGITNPTIIVGHNGSGKTEFTMNYALQLKEEGGNPVVADMDIVNPYFRARELKPFFEEKGIRIISNNYENDYHIDMPALATSLQTCFTSKDQCCVIDVGGDSNGANVLARYAKFLHHGQYNMWMVVNANRPKTSTAEATILHLKEIESTSKLKVNGLINATHMLRDTEITDLLLGDQLVKEISKRTGLQVVYTVVEERLKNEVENLNLAGDLFFIDLIMRPNWL